MRSERFGAGTLLLASLLFAACSRESPAPPTATTTQTATPDATRTPDAVVPRATVDASYSAGMDWLRSTPGFRFSLRDGEIEGDGEMTRETIGAERVTLRAAGSEWRASSGPRGITWEKRSGASWSPVETPAFGNRVYQRVTLAFDPQKREGEAQLIASDAIANHYRFTNANTGDVHNVWVSRSGGHVERLAIGDSVDLRISPLAER